MAMVNVVSIAAYGRIYWLRLIGLVQRSAATWRYVLHSSDEPGELSQWQCHDDNTITIVVAITIAIAIIIAIAVGPVAVGELRNGGECESASQYPVQSLHSSLHRTQTGPNESGVVRQAHSLGVSRPANSPTRHTVSRLLACELLVFHDVVLSSPLWSSTLWHIMHVFMLLL